MRRIAVAGGGGLAAAWLLPRRYDVALFEANKRVGGHAHTVHVPWRGGSVPVDVGFIVYNEPTYPNLVALFAALGSRPDSATNARYGEHYARTLAEWRTRYRTALPLVEAQGLNGRFRRLWEFYLAYCEGGFRAGCIDLRQVALAVNP